MDNELDKIGLDDEKKRIILEAQQDEITEYHIYRRLAERTKDNTNSQVLLDIADDELRHYNFWKEYSGREFKAKRWKVFFYYWIAVIFGLTFGIKLMEKGEENASKRYGLLKGKIAEVADIISDEDNHEDRLINLIKEERLQYVGSVVLGLNDALVELTGTLAGLTFALKNTNIIAMAGLITGIAASFSMAASEYLSERSEEQSENALKSSIYTGGAYIVTVFLLILPYIILENYFLSLIMTVCVAIMIIFFFNFYIAIAKDLNFKKRFLEMAAISLGVALLSFFIGYLIRVFLGVDI